MRQDKGPECGNDLDVHQLPDGFNVEDPEAIIRGHRKHRVVVVEAEAADTAPAIGQAQAGHPSSVNLARLDSSENKGKGCD